MANTAPTPRRPQLPELDAGLQLLTLEAGVTRALHALTVDHVLLEGGDACWIDPGTYAQSQPVVDLASSERILDRIRIARGFTPFQHLALLQQLPEFVTGRTELVVVPDLDGFYRNDDLLADEGQEMLLTGVASLTRVAREHDVPVLLTRQRADAFSEPIATAATREIRCESTRFGPRFRTGDEDETLVYPVAGEYVQTTLSFWERVLAARQPLYDSSPQEVMARGTN